MKRTIRHLPLALAILNALFLATSSVGAGVTNLSIVSWGYDNQGQTNVPSALNDVTAVAGGAFQSLACSDGGTVTGWGWNFYGQTTAPFALSNVAAVAAGYAHSLALKTDGTVVAWGWNGFGQASVPAGLSNVTAVAAGGCHNVSLRNDGKPMPVRWVMLWWPISRSVWSACPESVRGCRFRKPRTPETPANDFAPGSFRSSRSDALELAVDFESTDQHTNRVESRRSREQIGKSPMPPRPNPEGCQIVAGGHSPAKTSGSSKWNRTPDRVPDNSGHIWITTCARPGATNWSPEKAAGS
ncbi:exported hypothetical protein [Verrucomicrobia bacterium]|nr:exported hypothetical protein [Verrucomicrobiota bacterium]